MGPRSCERGNQVPPDAHMQTAPASMGPRSCERGNDLAWRAATAPDTLQWGRARASAEIRWAARQSRWAASASMGPRSCERGNAVIMGRVHILTISLQWGRARASAEIGNFGHFNPCLPLLQWGRARASAEMRLNSLHARWCISFNGAALVRARKSWFDARAKASVNTLQWGRARASAEMDFCGISPALDSYASMGPRSCERGNENSSE